MAEPPTGTVTFLFTDIEGSTRLLGQLGDRFRDVLEDHQRLLREAFTPRGGVERATEGDSFFVVFPSASDALAAAVDTQRALAAHTWPEDGIVRVRMGLHTGEGVLGGDDYVGMDVHRAARIAAAGHGGQVLVSDATRALVEHALPDGVSLIDLGEHRLKDLPNPERVFQMVIPGCPSDFPAIRSLDARPGNLPPQLTTFVGRGNEVEEVTKLLAAGRLVTLTGPGGTGKTRLSLEVAEEIHSGFGDGAFFVRLAPIQDPALVVTTIAATLGLREDATRTPFETLTEHLDGKAVLLVLDNFEQVLAAAPDVGRVLEATDNVRVLATSREVLSLRGEQEYPVPPLALPDPAHLPPLEALRQYEAVALFIDRARGVKPAFSVTNENAPAVAEICARLDGLPLAIELAAARVKILTPEAMLSRLEHRLTLLAGGARDLDVRQQTLRGAIAWSYDLLDEAEQRFFVRLAVFLGGFTLEAAEHVVSPGGEVGLDTIDGVASLANKSLIREVSLDRPEPRFLMLETIREYASERLDESPEADAIRHRHAEFFLTLAEHAEPELMQENQASWLNELEQEHNNLRAAFDWAIGHGQLETALRTGAALWRFWQMRGHLREARERLTALLEIAETRDLPEARARALEAVGGVTYWMADFAVAREFYQECLDIRREIGDKAGIAEALYNLAFTFTVPPEPLRDRHKGVALLEESLASFRDIDDRGGIARALWGLGTTHQIAGDYSRSKEMALEALSIHRELGNRFSEGWALNQLTLASMELHEFAEARSRAEEALEIFLEAGDLSGIGLILTDFAGIVFGEGDPERAVKLFGAASAVEAEVGTGLVANQLTYSGLMGSMRDAVDDESWERWIAEGGRLSVEEAIALAHESPTPADGEAG